MNIQFHFKKDQDGDIELKYDGDRPTTMSEGMDISIVKWKTIIEYIKTNNVLPLCGAMDTCGLCMMYHQDSCNGCPIAEKTGYTFCQNTPHEEWEDIDNPGLVKDGLEVATKELEFLQQIKYDRNL